MMAQPTEDDSNELYEHAPCGYLSMLPDGTIVRVNQTLLTWLIMTRDEVVGSRFQDLLTMPGRIFHDTHYMPLLTMQGCAREIAFDLKPSSGPPIPTIVTSVSKRDDAGAVILYRTAVLETSSRRSYERELVRQRQAAEHAAAERAALLAMLSHDIRSPLTSILTGLHLLARASEPEARARFLDVIRRASDSAIDLVNAILDHSRLEAGASTWEPVPTDVRALVGEISAIHRVQAEAKGIELRDRVDAGVPQTLLVDSFKLGQIVTNFVSNAIKFTETGHVQIELRAMNVAAREADIELRVSDTGIGIAPEHLGAIFDEFRQAPGGSARGHRGSGLGLAISRKLAALAGTTINVDSTVGAGTTFSCVFHVPIAQVERAESLKGAL